MYETIKLSDSFLVENLIERWAPLVFLAPGEKFYPSDVSDFLEHIIAIPKKDLGSSVYENVNFESKEDASDDLPKGRLSESWFLTTREDVGEYLVEIIRNSILLVLVNVAVFAADDLLKNSSSFIYGRNPEKDSVPVYALVEICHPDANESIKNVTLENESRRLHFHVTYWMFYPFSQGKSVCTVDMGRFGAWPIPKLNNLCLGNIKEFGNHVGDWEHMSLYFEASLISIKI